MTWTVKQRIAKLSFSLWFPQGHTAKMGAYRHEGVGILSLQYNFYHKLLEEAYGNFGG
jgi:hypothetical protein